MQSSVGPALSVAEDQQCFAAANAASAHCADQLPPELQYILQLVAVLCQWTEASFVHSATASLECQSEIRESYQESSSSNLFENVQPRGSKETWRILRGDVYKL